MKVWRHKYSDLSLRTSAPDVSPAETKARASVLIVVLWIVFGLISITLYFAHSMTFELRASDNRLAGMEAEQAIEGARRYLSCVLSNVNERGVLPDPQTYLTTAVPVGDARFWLIGRGENTNDPATEAHFGLTDEAAKLNLNSATSNMLINLPRMTPDLAANIVAWRSTNTTSLSSGAQSDTYMQMPQPYLCKNAPFETVDELRLVSEMDMNTLYGEDANLNGILDPNENDGEVTPPSDNENGQLEPGLLEYVTVYTKEPATTTNGTARFNITTYSTTTRSTLQGILTTNGIATDRIAQILAAADSAVAQATFTSTLQFFYSTGMTTAEFMKIESSIRGASLNGLVNINTASATVLSCLPGMTNGQAAQLISYREANTNSLILNPSMIWITQALQQADALAAAPYITGFGYQYMADIAAIGHNGRGYRRTRFIFDTSQGAPVTLHRQDLSQLGWALGKDARDKWLLGKQIP